MSIELRSYQATAIEQLRGEVARGHNRVLLQLPTGGGKTVILAAIVRGHLECVVDARVLVVVHRRELVVQTVDKLTRAGVRAGVLTADEDSTSGARVIVASLWTLDARGSAPPATMVIWDEAHRIMAASFRRVEKNYSNAIHIGVTATPERADGKPLGDVFTSMVTGASVQKLTALGHLVPSEVIGFGGATREPAMDPVDAYERFTPGRAAIVFASSVAHARSLVSAFEARGVRAACVDGETDGDVRDDVLRAFADGRIDVVTNAFVLCEGFDCPRAEVCILARSPEHIGTYLQMVGRVLRPSPGKRIATVIDLRGSAYALGLPDEDRRWQIDGPCLRTELMPALRRCKECFAIFRPVKKCPRCGASHKVIERVPRSLSRAEKAERLNDVPRAERDRRAVWGIIARLKRSPKYARANMATLMRTAKFLFKKSNGREPEVAA